MARNETPAPSPAADMLERIRGGLGAEPGLPIRVHGEGSVPSAFAVTDLATATIGAAGLALAGLVEVLSGERPEVSVDRVQASAWFLSSYRTLGWKPPAVWHPLAGDFEAADGWIRLHNNAPHHRQASLDVLGAPPERDGVAAAVRTWKAEALESEVVRAGGAAAAMRTEEEWAVHPQGAAVAAEPIVHRRVVPFEAPAAAGPGTWRRGAGPPDAARPLAGLRVLDLTRVLAGPVATRFLAGWGAQVLRIDPPGRDHEAGLAPDVTVGKRCARMNLRDPAERRHLLDLLASADVVVHGYRPGALEGLGLGEDVRREVRPGIVDASLDAYGWTGPWAARRGFDSLVQMSSGIAATGRLAAGADRPVSLPFQALDHATGYVLAACVLRGLTEQARDGVTTTWRASLARTAALLTSAGRNVPGGAGPGAVIDPRKVDADPAAPVEQTSWGGLRRLPSPLRVGDHGLAWDTPARPFGTDRAEW